MLALGLENLFFPKKFFQDPWLKLRFRHPLGPRSEILIFSGIIAAVIQIYVGTLFFFSGCLTGASGATLKQTDVSKNKSLHGVAMTAVAAARDIKMIIFFLIYLLSPLRSFLSSFLFFQGSLQGLNHFFGQVIIRRLNDVMAHFSG